MRRTVENFWHPLGVERKVIRKGHPEDNAFVERSNQTDDYEFYVPYLLQAKSLNCLTPYEQLRSFGYTIPPGFCSFPPLILDHLVALKPILQYPKTVQDHVNYDPRTQSQGNKPQFRKYYRTKEAKMKHKKPASIRDGAAERLQLGAIGALGTVIALFVFLGNVSLKPAKITGRSQGILPIIDPLIVDPKIIEPPPVDNRVVQFTKTDDDEKADTIMPGINADFDESIGSDRIKRSFEDVPIPPVDAIKPRILGDLDVKYPERMIAIEAEGLVIVGAALDEGGGVFDTRVLKSSGFAELDSAAVQAVCNARFSPAMQHDKPLAVKISVPVRFNLRSH